MKLHKMIKMKVDLKFRKLFHIQTKHISCHFIPNIPISTRGEQPVEDIPNFTCKHVSVRRLLGTTKKATDLKFGTHTPLEIIYFFSFFEKVTLRAASLEKLPRHVDFPLISSIGLFALCSSIYIYCQ